MYIDESQDLGWSSEHYPILHHPSRELDALSLHFDITVTTLEHMTRRQAVFRAYRSPLLRYLIYLKIGASQASKDTTLYISSSCLYVKV